jgi:23S rRNA pseudouridine1911/1915/1917 synthase
VVPESVAGAQRAELSYSTLESVNGQSLLEIKPNTGRSHQIRVQLADLGTPIVGDCKYGAKTSLEGVILLHAASLEFEHPTRKDWIRVEAPLPEQFGLALTM